MTLPLCVLGAGLVHAVCIAALVPVLVTVPAPHAGDGKRKIDVAALSSKTQSGVVPETPLVTGSIAQAASTVASAIAGMPREALRQTQAVPVSLASVELSPHATLSAANGVGVLLSDETVGLIGAVAAEQEIEARDAAGGREIVAAVDPKAGSVRRQTSAPQATRIRPKAAAATPRRRAALPVTRNAPVARRPAPARAQAANQPAGLGLLFRKPPLMRPQAARRPATQ